MNKNGKIIIRDWTMNHTRTQPISGAVFAINMLVGTEALIALQIWKSLKCYMSRDVKIFQE